jgi:hypothetical protein
MGAANWVGVVVGGALIAMGVLGYAGMMRFGPETFLGRPIVEIAVGSGLVVLMAGAAARDRRDTLAVALGGVGLTLFLLGVLLGVVGAPRWTRPRWQRESEDA